MKVNMPVTDREVLMKEGTILVTRTDLKGRITYANDAFIEISGFTRDELIGANHNIVRHPDMPAAAFKDLWQTIQAGRPWVALVKNRTKSGDYYWVEANVTPVFESGRIKEYLSVRYAPSREQIREVETLYADINRGKASLRPVGLAAWRQRLCQMPIWLRAALATAALVAPNLALLWRCYQDAQWMCAGWTAVLTFIGAWLLLGLSGQFRATLSHLTQVFGAVADERFRNRLDIDRQDEIGEMLRGLQRMQVKLNSDLAYSKQIAADSLRIKQALDNVQSCVMVADTGYNIIYMNNTVKQMFKEAEQDLRKDLPDFNADKLLGANIDTFHKRPEHQRALLDRLKDTYRSNLHIGGRHMTIVANPVINEDHQRIGTVVEWRDRTNEVKIENEIKDIVESVKAGELSGRIDLRGKEGFFATLSQGINELADVIEQVFSDVASVMQSMAAGDLTNKITNHYQGIYASCQADINATIDKLSEVFTQIREAADFINNSSKEIASGNNNLSQRAEEQASSLEETASSMEELTSTVKNNAENAQQANQLASTARQLAEKGGEVVKSAVAAMEEINQSSNKIADIIGVIDEIAFQTNLLALNASVEAARAGEQGRGFSVVATEVRNLAQRSATAARESKELIQNSVQKVRAGTEFVNQTGAALNDIVNGVKKVGDIIAEIAAASAEQSSGIEQVNIAVSQMDEITQQNAALAEEASAASVSMSEQAMHMVKLLDFFKTEKTASTTPRPVPQPLPAPTPASSHAARSTAPASAAPVTKKPLSKPPTPKAPPAPRDDDDWEEF